MFRLIIAGVYLEASVLQAVSHLVSIIRDTTAPGLACVTNLRLVQSEAVQSFGRLNIHRDGE